MFGKIKPSGKIENNLTQTERNPAFFDSHFHNAEKNPAQLVPQLREAESYLTQVDEHPTKAEALLTQAEKFEISVVYPATHNVLSYFLSDPYLAHLMVHLSDDFAGWSRMKEKASHQPVPKHRKIVLMMAFSGFHYKELTSQHSISADSADKNESKPPCSDDMPNELTLPTPLPDGLTLVSALMADVSILTADESAVLPRTLTRPTGCLP